MAIHVLPFFMALVLLPTIFSTGKAAKPGPALSVSVKSVPDIPITGFTVGTVYFANGGSMVRSQTDASKWFIKKFDRSPPRALTVILQSEFTVILTRNGVEWELDLHQENLYRNLVAPDGPAYRTIVESQVFKPSPSLSLSTYSVAYASFANGGSMVRTNDDGTQWSVKTTNGASDKTLTVRFQDEVSVHFEADDGENWELNVAHKFVRGSDDFVMGVVAFGGDL